MAASLLVEARAEGAQAAAAVLGKGSRVGSPGTAVSPRCREAAALDPSHGMALPTCGKPLCRLTSPGCPRAQGYWGSLGPQGDARGCVWGEPGPVSNPTP